MNVFEAVKQSVTTRQAAEHYGIHVGRNGMACCPFHNDKTPSMKLDRRYHCFGCGADGDVIDFTAALYGLGKKEAAVQLAQDFGLSYEDWKPPGKAKKPKPRQKSPEEQFQEAKNRCFRILADYLHLLRAWRKEYAPHSPEEAFHPRFIEALQKQDQVEYLLDVLLFPENFILRKRKIPFRTVKCLPLHWQETRTAERQLCLISLPAPASMWEISQVLLWTERMDRSVEKAIPW